jgi:hypothetical protein
MTKEEEKKAEDLKKAEEAKVAEEAKKADELKKAEEAKAAAEVKPVEKTISEETLLKAIDNLVEFSKARKVEEEEEEEEGEEFEESATGNFEEDETLEKAIEVSPFLEALVKETELSIGALGKSVGKELSGLKKSISDFDGKQIEAIKEVASVVKGLTDKVTESFKTFDERLIAIEQTPVRGPKSVLKAVTIEKSFAGKEGDFAGIPKRKVVDALEKAVYAGKIKDSVLIAYEAEPQYPLSEDVQDIVKSFLA